MNKTVPRGIRNTNPLNIERNKTRWKGLRKEQTDARFAQFETMEYGIRAAFRTLQTYYDKHGCRTIRQFISRWCPPTEKGNDTEQYISHVCRGAGVTHLQVLRSPKEACLQWCAIVRSMIKMECGQEINIKTIIKAYNMAFRE
jgi:hypothetical protein